ncbi:hypothetical protein ACFYV7_35860 [Nocardia suismassiliense]|uniref:Uncharacterized protein n=1 Tax=Nocardia suismassiliense TaxID=2077092 RepID=A0ABW6R558_9NOCA
MTTIDPVAPPATVQVNWEETIGTSRTTLTTHLWTAPPLRRESPIHDKAFDALRELRVDFARFLPWFSHPRVAVAELAPPTATETSWNFELLDPFVEDFVAASEGRPIVANFATIPTWMFVTPEPVAIAEDPDEIHWHYEQGSELRDPTCGEVADYFYRLASWYIAGGFTDELGRRHESGHRYRFAYWEVLCEPDIGHRLSPETYTKLYDAVVARLAPLDPDMKFVGLSLSHVHHQPNTSGTFSIPPTTPTASGSTRSPITSMLNPRSPIPSVQQETRPVNTGATSSTPKPTPSSTRSASSTPSVGAWLPIPRHSSTNWAPTRPT